ncbi:MAG: TetR/AcrR family transcriptional regulator [Desulfovibrio sp.]|jgi:AcrR family transcriptional regulator|nr:TetR/AcrR family transcriptional regulator [Desulfovibrio sp.]
MKKESGGKGKGERLSAEQRETVLRRAALDVFLEKGYRAASLDEIIRRAGGSRRTIYTRFGGKEALFKALVTEIADRTLVPMRQDFDRESSLRENLSKLADRLLSALLSPTVLDLSRLALAEGARFPELARAYFDAGPRSAAESFAALFDLARERGEISCPDSQTAAGQFVGILRDNVYLQVFLRLRPAPDQREREKIIAGAVEIFLHGLGTF